MRNIGTCVRMRSWPDQLDGEQFTQLSVSRMKSTANRKHQEYGFASYVTGSIANAPAGNLHAVPLA